MRDFENITKNNMPTLFKRIRVKRITSTGLCPNCLHRRELQFSYFIFHYNEIIELLQKDENIDRIIIKYDDLNSFVRYELQKWFNCSHEVRFSLQEIHTFQNNLHMDLTRYINIHIEELKLQLEDSKLHHEL